MNRNRWRTHRALLTDADTQAWNGGIGCRVLAVVDSTGRALELIWARNMQALPWDGGRDGVSPSVNMSGAGWVAGTAGGFAGDGRDLNGARNMQALPWDWGRDGVSPSLIQSGVGCVEGMLGDL